MGVEKIIVVDGVEEDTETPTFLQCESPETQLSSIMGDSNVLLSRMIFNMYLKCNLPHSMSSLHPLLLTFQPQLFPPVPSAVFVGEQKLGKEKSAAVASRVEAEQELQRIRSEAKREEVGATHIVAVSL